MKMLAMDTSNHVLAVALMEDNTVLAELSTNIKKDHSSRLMPAIVELMQQVDIKPGELERLIVARGPGSYTGTRIGVTTAKSMAWALDIPIIPVSSLEVMAYNGKYFPGYICPFIDARRESVFTALYRWEDEGLTKVKDEVNIKMSEWLSMLQDLDTPILFMSPDMTVFEEMIKKQCQHAVISDAAAQIVRPANLFEVGKTQKEVPAHEVAPHYLRITEAEANWLKQEKGETNHG